MSKIVKFSSPAPTGAIISQFYLALEKCFDMNKDECVYIEKDGDVSLINQLGKEEGTQTELKEYSETDSLTDSHINFWNTLNNWLSLNFDSKKYKYLILATTQEIGPKSSLQNWNTSNEKEKKRILSLILKKAESRLQTSLKKDEKASVPESLKLMRVVMSETSIIDSIIGKIVIDSSILKRTELFEYLKNVRLKFITEDKRESYLNSLLGFIVKSEEYNKGWEIDYKSFSIELSDLTTRYNENSVLFPYESTLTLIPEDRKKEFLEYNFINKIKEIKYDSVITKSLNNYWFTFNTINNEFKSRTQKAKSLIQFQSELLEEHSILYDSLSRKCKEEDVDDNSKDFFDNLMNRDTVKFDLFNNTPKIFKNGMYHILADEKDEIIWKLKYKPNE
jgi:hypothetical protein